MWHDLPSDFKDSPVGKGEQAGTGSATVEDNRCRRKYITELYRNQTPGGFPRSSPSPIELWKLGTRYSYGSSALTCYERPLSVDRREPT